MADRVTYIYLPIVVASRVIRVVVFGWFRGSRSDLGHGHLYLYLLSVSLHKRSHGMEPKHDLEIALHKLPKQMPISAILATVSHV